jgi:hypothetical protein
MLHELLSSIIDLENISPEKIRLSPSIELHLKHGWEDKKTLLKKKCLSIPSEKISNKILLSEEVEGSENMTLLLLAIGEKVGAWERFPSLSVDWNLPHWPYAIPLTQQHSRQ